jgi:two-component system cell cycle sensor histidine kinase/response regulator CckA
MSKALKASEDRFERFFEEAPLGMILVDSDEVIKDCKIHYLLFLITQM